MQARQLEALQFTDLSQFIARGECPALMGFAATAQFQEMNNRAMFCLEGWHWDLAVAGTTVDEVYPGWRASVEAAAQPV